MREIKFRGRDDEGQWHCGFLSWCTDVLAYICVGAEYEVEPATVGQFTGLKDCEGREIYEDDIVRVVHYGEESIHVIKYCDDMDYPAFDLWPHFDCESNGLSFCECERETTITVIGNVHDNPGFLKEGGGDAHKSKR